MASNELSILIKVIGGDAVAQLSAFKDQIAQLGPAITGVMEEITAATSSGMDAVVADNTKAAASFQAVADAAKGVGGEIEAGLAPVAASVDKAAASVAKLGESAKTASSEVTAGLDPMKAAFDGVAASSAGAADKTAAAWSGAKDKIVADAAEIKTALASMSGAQDTAAASAVVAGGKTADSAEKSASATKAGAGEVETATAATAGGFAKSGKAAEDSGKKIKGSTTDWAMAAGVFGFVTDKVVMSATNWDASMHKLVSTAGEVPKNLQMVSDGLLKIAQDTGTSTKDMADGMYLVESSGHHGADGLQVITAAAQMAKQENIPLAQSIKGVTDLMQDYPGRFKTAADATSFLVNVVGQGNMKMSDLSGAMGAVMPVASAMGVSVDSVAASLDEMTRHGVPAQQAAQNLRDVLVHMEAPTQVQQKELAALGLTTDDVKKSMDSSGLSGTLQMLSDRIMANTHVTAEGKQVILDAANAVKGYDPQVQALAQQLMNGTISQKDYTKAAKDLPPILQGQANSFATLMKSTHGLGREQQSGLQITQTYTDAMRRATGDQTGMGVALMTTGNNAKDTNAIQATLSATTKDADGSTKGWSETQRQANVELDKAKVSVQTLAINMATGLLPGVALVARGFAGLIGWIAQCKPLAEALGVVLGVVLVTAFAGFVGKGIGSAITGIKSLIGVIDVLTMGSLTKLGGALKVLALDSFIPMIKGVATAIKEWTVVQWLLDAAMDANPIGAVIVAVVALIAIVVLLVTHWQQVVDFFKGLWEKVTGFFTGAWDKIKKIVSDGWEAIKKFFSQSPKEILTQVGEFIGKVIAFFLLLPIEIPLALAKVAGFIVEKVKAWWPGFKQACEQGWTGTVWPWFKALPGKIVDALNDLGKLMLDVGKAVIEGLWHGIQAAAGALWDVVKGIGKGIVDQFKSVLGISSPSTVMHQHGRDTMAGAREGVAAEAPAVHAEVAKVPVGMVKQFDGTKAQMSHCGTEAMGGLHTAVESGTKPVIQSVTTMSGTMVSAVQTGITPLTAATATATTAATEHTKAVKASTSATTADTSATTSHSSATSSASSTTKAHTEATKDSTAATTAHTDATTANTAATQDSAAQLDALTKSMTDFTAQAKAAEPVWANFTKDTTTFETTIKATAPIFSNFTKDFTTFDNQLKAASPLWAGYVKNFAAWEAQLKAASPLWTTYVKDFTAWDAQLKAASPLWTQYVKDFTSWEAQLKAASPLWTLYVKDFTTWTAQLKIASPLWTTYVKNFTTWTAQLKAASPLWATFVKNFTTFGAQLKIVSALWATFVKNFTTFATLLAQVSTKMTQFVATLKLMQQTIQQLAQQFQQFNQQLTQTNQTVQQLTQSIRQADDVNNQFETDLGTTTDQLYQLQQQIVYVTQSLLDMEQMETWAAQEFSWMGIDAQQAGKEIDQAMQEAGKAVDKLDESVKKLIDDLKKLIELMKQAGISGGSGGGGGGGAGSAGAATGQSAVAGLTGSSGIASASPSQKTAQAGRDFVAGFTGAIDNGQGEAADVATSLGAGAVKATADAIGAASESRLLREIGRWFVEGFMRGIREEREHCRRTCEDVATVAVQTFAATSTLNAQFNTGTLYGKNLANGIVSSISMVKVASGKLAQAATEEATAQLAKMGLVGQAGSGAQMPVTSGPYNIASSAAQQGGQQQHCVHEHRFIMDGREFRDVIDKQFSKHLDKLTDRFSQQKR